MATTLLVVKTAKNLFNLFPANFCIPEDILSIPYRKIPSPPRTLKIISRYPSTSGSVKVKLDVSEDIKGKDVLVIDDIIDSGVTFASITDMLRHYKPATLKTAALCDKAERRVNGLEADYVGFKIPDEFVVGYGLDYAGDYRNLPFIGILKPAVYARK